MRTEVYECIGVSGHRLELSRYIVPRFQDWIRISFEAG